MASGDEKFTCGRHNGKTYAFVEETDKKFCQLALATDKPSKYVPETFKNYLKSRLQTDPIKEYCRAKRFFDSLSNSAEKVQELVEIIGKAPVTIETKHKSMNFRSNGFKGVFFRLAFAKYIFNKNNVNAHTRVSNSHVKVFPFKIEDVRSLADEIVSRLDDADTFVEEIREFTNIHFDDFAVERLHDVIDNFLSNIVNFCQNHFVGDAETKVFRRWVNNGFKPPLFETQKQDNVMKQFPRLNDIFVERYTVFYDMYNKIVRFYGQKTVPIPTMKEFKHLFEINVAHLCSLIDQEFFEKNRVEYVSRFKKYIFFFMYSTLINDGEESSVFFIDDCLFECAKALSTYRQCGADPKDIKLEVSLCALIHRRNQPHDDERRKYDEPGWCEIKDEDLIKIEQVAESYRKIETPVMHERVKSEQLSRTMIYLRTDDELMDFYLSFRPKVEISDFFRLIVCAALYNDVEFKKLVIYNALLGQITSIEMTLEKQLKVYEFIEKYNTSVCMIKPLE